VPRRPGIHAVGPGLRRKASNERTAKSRRGRTQVLRLLRQRPSGNFDECVAPDYVDYGHEPPGIGPAGARDDYENAVKLAGGLITYTIDVLVADGDMVAAVWTGTLPSGATFQELSLFRTTGGLLRSTRHELIGDIPL
jgi:SnoaL-like domain